MDNYIKGIFAGLLMSCFFMLVAPKQMKCKIEMTKGNATYVYVGAYRE